MEKNKFQRISLDSFHLKIIAIVAMLINHLGTSFHLSHSYPVIFCFTEIIGKITFPVMAFLLVEGFHYTHNVKKYASRLAIFWLISIYPFHWLHYPLKSLITPDELVNNIFFTLLMGLLLIWSYSKITNKIMKIAIVVFFSLATILSDLNVIGPLIIFSFYIIKDKKKKVIIPMITMTSFIMLIYIILYFVYPASIPNIGTLLTGFGPLINIPLLLSYNGKRGKNNTYIKWGFYWFYPVHLTLLALLRYLILGW